MIIKNRHKRPKGQTVTIPKKLLGSLELEMMEFMWQAREATVRQVTKSLNLRRPVAYTTVMTTMGHLVNKRLLTRAREGKRYRYRLVWSRDEFLREASRNMIRTLIDDFGDLAIEGFLKEINKVDADRRADFIRQLTSQAQQ